MTSNDILRRLRYAFDFSDQQAVNLFSLDPGSAVSLSTEEFTTRLLNEEDKAFCACSDTELCAFLDGLIVSRRGLRDNATAMSSETPSAETPSSETPSAETPSAETPSAETPSAETPSTLPENYRLSKNDVLKKLRIAMNYREQDMLRTLKLGGTEMSKSELGALFRSPQHKHYRPAGNQVLRAFIKGLTSQLRT